MKKHLANIITGIRILCSIWMLFFPAFSAPFFMLYLICGLTDMADGTVARKTNSANGFGSKLDSAADCIFIAAAFIKLLPALNLPAWLWAGIIVIGIIKIANVLLGFVRNHRYVVIHTTMNKLTGFLLFLFPLTVSFVGPKYIASAVCTIALCSAIQEGYYVWIGKDIM